MLPLQTPHGPDVLGAEPLRLQPWSRPLERTLDAGLLNTVANRAEVRHWLGEVDGSLTGRLDLSPLVEDPRNVCLVVGSGGFVCQAKGPGCYEVHSMFVPDGRETVRAMREGCTYMFTQTDCVELQTRVPANNRPAAMLARFAGFREWFSRPASWKTDAGMVDVSYQTLPVRTWVQSSRQALEAGRAFHALLERTKAARGSEREIHPVDDAHDHAAGAAVLMALAGNTFKAVTVYNEWATFAGYEPIFAVSEHPSVVDLVDAVVGVRRGEIEVLLCR